MIIIIDSLHEDLGIVHKLLPAHEVTVLWKFEVSLVLAQSSWRHASQQQRGDASQVIKVHMPRGHAPPKWAIKRCMSRVISSNGLYAGVGRQSWTCQYSTLSIQVG